MYTTFFLIPESPMPDINYPGLRPDPLVYGYPDTATTNTAHIFYTITLTYLVKVLS